MKFKKNSLDWKDSLETEDLVQIQINAQLKKVNAHDKDKESFVTYKCETVVYYEQFQISKFKVSKQYLKNTVY